MAPGALAPHQKASQNYYDKHIAPALNFNVPSHIKCNRCDYVKPSTSFSTVKKNDLKLHMQKKENRNFDAKKTAYVSCTNCTSGQVVELQCNECDEWKGVNKFNKTQRKKDHPRCEKCCEVRANYEPGAVSDDDSEGSGGSDDSDDDEDGEDYSLSGATSSMSLNDNASTLPSGSTRGGVSLGDNTSTAPSTLSSIRGTPNGGKASPFSTTNSTDDSSGGGKFAKTRAVHQKVVYHTAEKERERERAQASNGKKNIDDVEIPGSDSDSDTE